MDDREKRRSFSSGDWCVLIRTAYLETLDRKDRPTIDEIFVIKQPWFPRYDKRLRKAASS